VEVRKLSTRLIRHRIFFLQGCIYTVLIDECFWVVSLFRTSMACAITFIQNQHEENIIAPAKLQSYQITLLSFRLKILESETNHPTSPCNLSLTQGMHKSSARKVILQNANKRCYNHSLKIGAVIEPVRLSVFTCWMIGSLVHWFNVWFFET
jgi:hypothetical protein